MTCKHQEQLVPMEDIGFDYDEETKTYFAVNDDDIPKRPGVKVLCVECSKLLLVEIEFKLKEVTEIGST